MPMKEKLDFQLNSERRKNHDLGIYLECFLACE